MSATLRQVRRMKDISMREMADKIGVCEDTYRKIERNPEVASIATAKQISEILGLGLEEIFYPQILIY